MSSELRISGRRVTYVPEPWRRTTSPSSIRPRTASRIVTRLTPNRSHSRSSFGSFEPNRELAAEDQALQLAPDDVGEQRPAAGRGIVTIDAAADGWASSPS